MSEPRILLFDIETMANRAWVWGKYEQDVIDFDLEWYMIAFAFKWYAHKKTFVYALPDSAGYEQARGNDSALSMARWELFDKADIVIGHNSDAFDIKKANARFVAHGLPPYTPFQSIDTLKIARRHFKFTDNRLDALGATLGLGRKLKHEGWGMWKDAAFHDDKSAWSRMKEYNRQDVRLLEAVYDKLKPWMPNHPNLNLYNDTQMNCPICGSDDVMKNGTRKTRTAKQQRYLCNNCGGSSHRPISQRGVLR